MNNLKKYYGVLVLVITGVILFLILNYTLIPLIAKDIPQCNSELEKAYKEKEDIQVKLQRVQQRIAQMKNSIATAQKKIYTPVESDLGQDTLFFTLYNDIIEMVHTNSIKVKSIEYTYNPKNDAFVEFGNDVYFVCDVNMDLVSNYINLGRLIEDLYKYPYYIKINKLEVLPYEKDKKILLTSLSLRLYAHTTADSFADSVEETTNVVKEEQ